MDPDISDNETDTQSELFDTVSTIEIVWPTEKEDKFPLYFRIILNVLYNVVLICGVVGNVLVLYVIYSVPRMRTVTNYLLGNLAVGDLIITVLCVPFTYISIIYGYWPFGTFLCHFVSPTQAIGVLVSAFTLIAISFEKYVAILHPLAPRLRKSRVGWVIGAIWIAACLIASPIAVVSHVEEWSNSNASTVPICVESGWITESVELGYNIALMMLQYFIPVVVLVYTYTRISCVVWGIQHDKPSAPSDGEIALTRNSRSDTKSRKAVLLTFAVVAGFTLAWLPFNVNYIVGQHSETWSKSPAFIYVSIICHWLAMSHCFYNPLIYAWINNSFRAAFKDVYQRVCCCRDRADMQGNFQNKSSFSTSLSTFRWKNYRKISIAPDLASVKKKESFQTGNTKEAISQCQGNYNNKF